MNRKQERKFSMYKAVMFFLQGTLPAIIAKMPDMDNAIAYLAELVQRINIIYEGQETNRTGFAASKETSRDVLINTIFVLGGQVKSFAVNTANQVLKNEVSYTMSSLNAMADTRLYTTAERIIAKANQNIASLATYGVTPASVTQIQALLDQYGTKTSEPRNATSEQVEETNKLESLIKETDTLLVDKMDTYVIIVKNSDPAFFNIYHSNRKIIGPAYQTLAFRCFITDENQQPIAKVAAKIDGINKTYKTTAKGSFQIKSLPNGMHTITFTRANYETKTTTFGITKGIRTDLYVTLKQLEP